MKLEGLAVLVLDEADRMLDMGFAEAITDVAGRAPPSRQTMLFSATFPPGGPRPQPEVPAAARRGHGGQRGEERSRSSRSSTRWSRSAKMAALTTLLREHAPETALVFCHTRKDTREVANRLGEEGFSVLALHGELDQRQREEVLLRFAHRSCSVLVATDIAARGLDIKGLSAVISWELPIDPDVHVHRIGRTGRAGEKGLALSLCSRRERDRLRAIEGRMAAPARWEKLGPGRPRPERSRRPWSPS